MTSTVIPTWVGALWTAVFVAVFAVHLRHLAARTGRARLWHGAHVLMALGMVDMFLPAQHMGGGRVGVLVFASAAAGVVALVVADAARRKPLTLLWPVTTIDLTAMVYMFAMTSTRSRLLTGVLVAWLIVEALSWGTGLLATLVRHGGLGLSRQRAERVPAMANAAAPEPLAAAPARTTGEDLLRGWAIRASLTVMSIGMAYMLIAMQLGADAMTA